jgi:hypothetical protein
VLPPLLLGTAPAAAGTPADLPRRLAETVVAGIAPA